MSITVLCYYEEHFDMRYCYKMMILYITRFIQKTLSITFYAYYIRLFMDYPEKTKYWIFMEKNLFYSLYKGKTAVQ